ncbi:Plant invertase/pectin methylesterase inhibitor superfamily protein [Tripterygium wilfordii]|uniref:Plant invertase/pectin methylesterase inhibitor superfamily protein n=1 Tax=Tripterygium wilfordii TaxID=458696 RepID=A0A7J7CBV7_TRIWF|nr:putative invertase inhibitor [Tripterygium wilfordii]KAF5731570.1 Plant invertase/pectin methylesterase inhibitor superfamily protein [Tripterygium wilfordii]
MWLNFSSSSSSSFSLLMFLLFLFTFHALAAQDIINTTCQKCSQHDPKIDYNFCVTSLQADPRTRSADLRKLGLISIKLLAHNLTTTRQSIEGMLKKKKINDPHIRACLNDCLELYSDAIDTIEQSNKDYKSKHYEDANMDISSVMDASTTCEHGFKEKDGASSPLTKRNNNVFQLSAIALSIINMLRS